MESLTDELTEYASASRLVVSWAVAGLCLVAYDYVLTFDRERKYVWNRARTPGSILFLTIRYLPFLDLPLTIIDQTTTDPSAGICTALIWWWEFSCVMALALADAVVGLRTWAIWGRSTACAVFVVAAWLGATGTSLYYQVVALRETIYVESMPMIPGCFIVADDATTLMTMFTIYAVYEALIFIATFVRGLRHLRYTPAQLTSILYRDAFLTSATLLAIVITNIIVMRFSINWGYGMAPFYRAMNAILPARIILNIREAVLGPGTLDGWDVTVERDTGEKTPANPDLDSRRVTATASTSDWSVP